MDISPEGLKHSDGAFSEWLFFPTHNYCLPCTEVCGPVWDSTENRWTNGQHGWTHTSPIAVTFLFIIMDWFSSKFDQLKRPISGDAKVEHTTPTHNWIESARCGKVSCDKDERRGCETFYRQPLNGGEWKGICEKITPFNVLRILTDPRVSFLAECHSPKVNVYRGNTTVSFLLLHFTPTSYFFEKQTLMIRRTT